MFDSWGRGASHFIRRFGGLAVVFAAARVVQDQPAAARAKPQIISYEIISYDMGGDLGERIRIVERLSQNGTEVRIEGTRVSACTLYLGLPNSCVMAGAILGFHGPRTRTAGLPLPREDFDRLSAVLAGYYPRQIRQWFWSEARMVTQSYFTISGRQAAKKDARLCT
jgi:hypothetical protein